MIYTIEGNTSSASGLVPNGGSVARKTYSPSYGKIKLILRPAYRVTEASKLCQEAARWVGYLEKRSASMLDDFTANAGNANYNIFADHARRATGSGVYVNGFAWCDMFCDDMFIRAFGVPRALELLGGWSAYTPTSAEYLRRAGAVQVSPNASLAGDIIFFHNGIEICHIGIVTGNNAVTTGSSTFTIGGYTLSTIRKGDRGEMVRFAQQLLIAKGFRCGGYGADGDFGDATYNAVCRFQASRNLDVDGICGRQTWYALFM